MDSNSPDPRGTANRGVGTAPPERNVPLGNVVELIPKRLYNVVGFDIGSADISKPGIREGLESIVQQLLTTDDVRPSVLITGHASESRFSGKGPEFYERARAAAIKNYLVSRGVNKNWIRTATSGSGRLPASSYLPEQRAAARAATIEIALSGEKRRLSTIGPSRMTSDTRSRGLKLTRFGISPNTYQYFRDAQERGELFFSEWTVKGGIDIERHSLRWVERGEQYTEKMQNVLRFKGIKQWGPQSEDVASKINQEVDDQARMRVFRFLAETDPSFRELVTYYGGGNFDAGLRNAVNSGYAK